MMWSIKELQEELYKTLGESSFKGRSMCDQLVKMLDRYSQLEKALNEACMYLEVSVYDETYSFDEKLEIIKKTKPFMTTKQWKEYLLNDK